MKATLDQILEWLVDAAQEFGFYSLDNGALVSEAEEPMGLEIHFEKELLVEWNGKGSY